VKRVVLLALLLAVAAGTASARPSAPAAAPSNPCALPAKKPVWVDFADGSVPFWRLFGQPGVVAAASNFIFPPQLQALGARTEYWDMNLVRRVGSPTEPADPAIVVDRANRLYTYASQALGCSRFTIVENELYGARTQTPWSPGNAQYRANVLSFLRTLAARGARPVLLVNSAPYTGGEAADWWRSVAQVAELAREVYFPATLVYKKGAVTGSRDVRMAFRQGVLDFTEIGIPASRIGLVLGFHTTRGSGGREGLQPASSWFRTVKWQAFAARQVAAEMKIASIYSWGWASWTTLPQEIDPDKSAAACVYLWTRDPRLCDAPKVAGPTFDTSRTEGQLILPKGARCVVGRSQITWSALRGLSSVTQDVQLAMTALYGRAVTNEHAQVTPQRLAAAERAVIAAHFGGSRAAYFAALQRAHTTPATARGVIADELRRLDVQSRIRVAVPAGSAVKSFYDVYAPVRARQLRVSPRPSWLGGAQTGFAVETVAPPQVFSLPTGRTVKIRTIDGVFKVRALGGTMQLGELPLHIVSRSIKAGLMATARADAFDSWLLRQEQKALKSAICWRDQAPSVGTPELATFLPFLAPPF
jgi:hypothetical protein